MRERKKKENGLKSPGKLDKFLNPLHKNNDDYVAFIYRFAQVVVPKHMWWDRKEVNAALTSDEYLFGQFFSISDEAFIIVVLENYLQRWHELKFEKLMGEGYKGLGKSFRKKMEEVWILKHLLACCTIYCIHNFLHQNTGRIRSRRGIVGRNKQVVGNGKFRQPKMSK
jgi:hypothetical protein